MIRLIKPYLDFSQIEEEARAIVDSGILTRGEYSRQFPKAMCEYTGAKYAFNTSSATTALAISLEILNVKQGDGVIVSDFSFPATVNVVEATGARPIFADVSRETFNMLPEELEKKITPRTKAVIFVCALGNPEGLDDIAAICQAHSIPLINDAACAIGSRSGEKKVGNSYGLSCFSFHPRKLLTAGEGGSVTTNNPDYANLLEIKLMHGEKITEGVIDFVTYGYNYRLPELQCLMLLKQLEQLDDIVSERNATMETYRKALEPLGLRAQRHSAGVLHNMQSVVFLVPDGMSRNGLISHLRGMGIESTIGTYCQSNCTYYREKYSDVQPNSLWLEANTITLPCYRGVDVPAVVAGIRSYCV